MAKVAPGGVLVKDGGEDFARVIICGEDEVLEMGAGPPLVRRGVVLPEFADAGALRGLSYGAAGGLSEVAAAGGDCGGAEGGAVGRLRQREPGQGAGGKA